MNIRPLICPQCGGEIDSYLPEQTMATCKYCGVRFVIEHREETKPEVPVPVYEDLDGSATVDPSRMVVIIAVALLFTIGLIIIGVVASLKTTRSTGYEPIRKASPTPAKGPTASSASDPELLEFGGKGTANGLFKDANSVAVDKQGRIYVSDDSLRVQQFDPNGQFLKVLQAPQKTANYGHARTIDKIAAGDDGKLYVAIGGVILIFDERSSEPVKTIHFAPSYIQDFALRSDGGMLAIIANDQIETLLFLNKAGQVTKRISGFHTKAADAAMSPRQTGLAAIRLAVDGAGNIFSVYAMGDLGSYSMSYNAEELLIFRFTPDGKYVNKFVKSMNSCGIAVDNQSRIYVSEGNSINIYKNNGELVTSVAGTGHIAAFALDKENNIYLLHDDKIVKRPAINN